VANLGGPESVRGWEAVVPWHLRLLLRFEHLDCVA
jgi:hypothetical protein